MSEEQKREVTELLIKYGTLSPVYLQRKFKISFKLANVVIKELNIK